MKKLYTRILLCMGLSAFAQTPEIKTEMPAILPPAPTASALMKFEEIPIDNYTGIPDISIPIFSTPTRSGDINLDMSLKYHPASAAASETASDAGLGWSMILGGTVSRTVRGIPDEHLVIGKKSGIYRTEASGNPFPNPYYELIGRTGEVSTDTPKWNEFLWNAQEKGIYDTEHDLWQFNFMGYSGRFIIKKNSSGQLEVVIQDLSNSLKIVNHYNTANFAPTGFTIYDDKGYKYVFDAAETTDSSTSIDATYYGIGSPSDNVTSLQPTITYISAFQLTQIIDNNQKPIISFNYNPVGKLMEEISVNKSQTSTSMENANPDLIINNFINVAGDGMQGQNKKLEPRQTSSIVSQKTASKKVQRIDVDGIAKIYIDYQSGRLDQSTSASAYRIKSIRVKTWSNDSIRKIELFHSYASTLPNNNRMFLDSVTESNFADAKKQTYRLHYDRPFPESGTLAKDLWGYFTLRPDGLAGINFSETSPKYCTVDILQKMDVPTGGSILFNFESNEYSNIGDMPVTDFSGNPLNWTPQTTDKTITTRNVKSEFFTIAHAQRVIFNTAVSLSISDWRYQIYNEAKDVVATLGYASEENEIPPTEFAVFLPPGTYSVDFNSVILNLPPFTADITAHYKISSGADKQYLYGGGVRIRRIGFFAESNVPQDYYSSPSGFTPSMEKKYEYRSFGQPARSSGSLVFGVPLFEYTQPKTHNIEFECGGGGNCIEYQLPILYRIRTDSNNLQVQRTKGSDVGYQNATVIETGNGRTEYTYYSPIDVPENEDAYNITYPFYPSENLDHRRGYLRKEEVFDNNSRILSKTDYEYDFIDEAQNKTLIGIRPHFNADGCPGSYKFDSYALYLNRLEQCAISPMDYLCTYLCGPAIEYITYKTIYEAYGWTKLKKKATKSYFYEGTPAKTVETSESYTYNDSNKQISSQTINTGMGETLKTEFFYHAGNSPYSQNRISEIERIDSYRNSELLESSKIGYSASWAANASYLPQLMQSSTGTNALETDIRYTGYDEYGNVLEVQQENGMKVSYIWGYEKTKPVAKIENIAYADIPSSLVTAIQNVSNAVPYSEASMQVALNNLRNDAALAGAMVTTYSYKPLVGVAAITDPKGDKISYVYDSFARLRAVYDKEGNLLSENKYHYRTQN